MKKLQVQGLHHITLVGSTKQSALDFWQGVLGMPFVMEQPNLGKPDENHLYFDPGDGRLLTVFTNEATPDAGRHAPRGDRQRGFFRSATCCSSRTSQISREQLANGI